MSAKAGALRHNVVSPEEKLGLRFFKSKVGL